MADNVNIIVQDTINDIVVNAAVVVETIDINVQAAVDTVDIVANPNNYVVNINRIIGEQVQSDWTQTDNQAPDYIKNKPSLAAVATSGDYDDLINKPTIPTNTSDLVNDGENGVDPFITAADIPPVTGFVPYTGATEDVNLGEFGLLTGNVEFDNTPTNIPTTAGAMYWNDADGTADLILKGGNVKLQVGQESVIRVVNKTATNINLLEANYQAVRVTGAQGQRLKVDLAQATTDNLSAETIGLVTETINNNQEGFITTSGLVRNINTTGSLQGETWADGDILYLSPTTAGNVTKVKPTAPNHLVVIGYVVHAHANQGSIFVKVDNGYELDELHNVKITSAANNNVLAYTSATDIWENKTVETALGYTPQQELVSGTNIKTINGASVLGSGDLVVGGSNIYNANGTLTSARTVTSGGFPLTFTGSNTAASAIARGLNLTHTLVAAANNDVLVGLDIAPTFTNGAFTGTSNIGLRIEQGTKNGNNTRNIVFKRTDVANFAAIGYQGLGWNIFGIWGEGTITSTNAPDIGVFSGSGVAYIKNKLLINITTDAGFKLDVNGTARVSGQMSVNGYTISSPASGTIKIGTNPNTTGTNVTAFGQGAITTNAYTNSAAFGESSLGIGTGAGNRVVGVGYLAGYSNSGSFNTYLGGFCGWYQTTGTNNVFVGDKAGELINSGAILAIANSSIFLGQGTRALADNQTNQIVIGQNAIGAGSNTATLGNASIVDTILRGRINLQQYATGSRPTYVKGALIYDSTLGKLVVGGATGWEVVTSV